MGMRELNLKHQRLRQEIGRFDSALVAYSGGVDSSLVAYVTATELGPKALAVTSGSASLKRSDLNLAKQLAEQWRMPHRVIVTNELSNPDYRANPTNRCFYCKTTLYAAMQEIAQTEGFAAIFNGTNCDDLGDHRPGLIAANDFAVHSPLVAAGFNKADVRALAARLGLDNAEKPQSACLSSRFPYGTPIDEGKLAQVEQAEAVLERFGFRQCRVRHHDDVARLELLVDEFDLAIQNREAIERDIMACGYRFVALDLSGFQSGSLNRGVVKILDPKAN
tara:strand:- start:3473 stop:4306 length:834 start_codon:yes stop_codon:yes gene_type:complete